MTFLGPLKPLRRDPPVIYLVLRPWQNIVGIELGLILGGFSLLVYGSGWSGSEYAIVATPVCVAMVLLGGLRLFWRHRIRIESRGLFREQGTPSSRLTEQRPATDVTLVYLRSLWGRRFWGLSPYWGVSVAFRSGEEWLLTASKRPWAERRLARAIATIVQAPLLDQSIEGSLPVSSLVVASLLAPGRADDGPAPDDPAMTVLNQIPRRVVVLHPSTKRARHWLILALGLLVIQGIVAANGQWVIGIVSGSLAVVATALAIDAALARAVITFTLEAMEISRRGLLPRRPRRFAWRSLTVLGRDSLSGALLIADDKGQMTIGAHLSTAAVEWLIAKAHAYLPERRA